MISLATFSNPLIPINEIHEFYGLESIKAVLNRPYCWSNSITTIDGVMHFLEDDSVSSIGMKHVEGISEWQQADWRLLNAGWAYSDAILITGQILRSETDTDCYISYEDLIDFRIRNCKSRQPIICLISGSGEFPAERPIFKHHDLEIWIFTIDANRDNLESRFNSYPNIKIHSFGSEINIEQLMVYLKQQGISYLDVSGGGSIIRAMLDLKQLDEIRFTMAGHLAGFKNSTGLNRPLLHPSHGKSYTPSDAPLVSWNGIRTIGRHHIFFRGVLQYRH